MHQEDQEDLATPGEPRLITRDEAVRISTASLSTIQRGVRAGTFPAPVHIGRAVRYVREEVMQWVESRIASRDVQGGA
jgi:predicted DNA-binding transcriptional regulator AlpA